jgi:hypothetical protein
VLDRLVETARRTIPAAVADTAYLAARGIGQLITLDQM